MRVVCDRRDQDLLFLSQGMLSGARRLWTGLHVKRCSACQERMRDFSEASRHLRLAFGASPVVVSLPRRVSRLALAAGLAVLLAAAGTAAYLIIDDGQAETPGGTRSLCTPANQGMDKPIEKTKFNKGFHLKLSKASATKQATPVKPTKK
jgi:hypothetical protein